MNESSSSKGSHRTENKKHGACRSDDKRIIPLPDCFDDDVNVTFEFGGRFRLWETVPFCVPKVDSMKSLRSYKSRWMIF